MVDRVSLGSCAPAAEHATAAYPAAVARSRVEGIDGLMGRAPFRSRRDCNEHARLNFSRFRELTRMTCSKGSTRSACRGSNRSYFAIRRCLGDARALPYIEQTPFVPQPLPSMHWEVRTQVPLFGMVQQ